MRSIYALLLGSIIGLALTASMDARREVELRSLREARYCVR